MSLSLIDKLHQQAKNASTDDINKICKSLLEMFYMADKAPDCMAMLRQLYFILQAADTKPSVPVKLILNLVKTLTSVDRGKLHQCILCQRIVQELLPLDDGVEEEVQKLEDKVPSSLHLQVFQGKNVGCLSKLFANAVRWIQSQDVEFEVQRKAFSFLIGVSTLHSDITLPEKIQSVNERVGNWLLEVSMYQAPNPYTSNPFRKDQNNLVTEVDGTSSTNFFTVLNIGQYYTEDQLMNIYSFSMLYQWIHYTYTALANHSQYANEEYTSSETPDDKTVVSSNPRPVRPRSATPTTIARSASNEMVSRSPAASSPQSTVASSVPYMRQQYHTPLRKIPSTGQIRAVTPSNLSRSTTPVEEQKPMFVSEKRNVAQGVFDSLVGRTLDYCFRILDQCDRKPKVPSDVDLQNACLLETVKLLDLICKIDGSQIPKAFRELKRLSSVNQEQANPSLSLVILQFLINHCGAVAYDPQEELKSLFHGVLSRKYNSHKVGFDIVLFILDNLEELCHDYDIMSTYFPNILKLLAWNPRTFVSEFVDIVPAMMSLGTSLEVFHALVDLPCMTAALEVMERMKNVDFSNLSVPATAQEPSNSIEAFKNAMYRPMFNFFTRSEGGHGDTINRLDKFHSALQDMTEHPRVMVCCQTVPVLLRVWFSVILEEGTLEFIIELLPVLLERTSLLFGISEYQTDVIRIISENIILLIKKFPEVVLNQQTEITDFLSSTRNIVKHEDFFCQLIWAVGEYVSAEYNTMCTAETVVHVYEVLEVLTYEVIGVTASTSPEKAPYTVKVVSMLMSALSKLATRCQDLIPRAILCLTKVAKQHQNSLLEKEQREILFSRAQELINLLKMPNFASVILNPPAHLASSRIHRDSSSVASMMRATYRFVSPPV